MRNSLSSAIDVWKYLLVEWSGRRVYFVDNEQPFASRSLSFDLHNKQVCLIGEMRTFNNDPRFAYMEIVDIQSFSSSTPPPTAEQKLCGKARVSLSSIGVGSSTTVELILRDGSTYTLVDYDHPKAQTKLDVHLHNKEICVMVSQIKRVWGSSVAEISGLTLASSNTTASQKCGRWEVLFTIFGRNYNLRMDDSSALMIVDEKAPFVTKELERYNDYRGRMCVTGAVSGGSIEVSSLEKVLN